MAAVPGPAMEEPMHCVMAPPDIPTEEVMYGDPTGDMLGPIACGEFRLVCIGVLQA